jgi:hypothetical protein
MKYLYKHNLPFSEIVAINIDDLIERIRKRKASLIIVDGLMGEGKTTLAVEVAEYVEKHAAGKIEAVLRGDLDFYEDWIVQYKKQLAMGGDDFQEKLEMCKDSKLLVCIYDEAGDFSKKGAITQFNQRLMRVFQTFRTFNILIILCLPCFDILENDLFKQGVPRLLLNCHERTERHGNIRGYALDEMFYLKKHMRDLINPLKAYKMVVPNFRGHFLDLPPERSDELDALSTAAKSEVLSKNILKNRGLVNLSDISRRIGRSHYWTRIKLRELGIDPTTVYKKLNYYEESVLHILEEHKR